MDGCPGYRGGYKRMSNHKNTSAGGRAGRGMRTALKHGLVVVGACVAFAAALAVERLASSALEVKIECSSKGIDVASWMSRSEWERSARSGSVRMNADGFYVAIRWTTATASRERNRLLNIRPSSGCFWAAKRRQLVRLCPRPFRAVWHRDEAARWSVAWHRRVPGRVPVGRARGCVGHCAEGRSWTGSYRLLVCPLIADEGEPAVVGPPPALSRGVTPSGESQRRSTSTPLDTRCLVVGGARCRRRIRRGDQPRSSEALRRRCAPQAAVA